MPKPVAPDSDDSIYTTIKSVKPVSKFSMDPIMDDFASEPKKIKKSIERKSNNNSIIIESDSDATTIISNRSHMSFASKSSKNTFVANSTLNPSENATKATERSLGYFRDRIASKAKELSPESEQKQDLKLHKNKENKNINSNSINNNISLDPIVYKGTSPAQKDELEKRVVITPKADLNENQSFYTFHQPDPTDREMIKAPSKEHNSHGKTIDTNNHKIILPEIGFYTSKHQTQAQIDRDFNPYADSIKNFRKVYGKIDRTGSKQQARGRNHINDSQEMINPNYPLKPYKARPSSQVKALKKPEPKPPASTKNNRSSSTSNKSPMNSTLAIERHPTPKEMLPRKVIFPLLSEPLEHIKWYSIHHGKNFFQRF